MLCIAAAVLGCAEAASESYELQRRFDDGEWSSIATFTIQRQTSHSPARVKSPPAAMAELSASEKTALVSAQLVSYRAFQPGNEANAVVVSTSPCSIIRGFDAVDSRTVLLKQRIKVVPGTGTSLLGLQIDSETNFFHAKMLNGDECDKTVVQKLFPVVQMKVEVEVANPTPVKAVRYSDLKILSEQGAPKKNEPKVTVKRVKNEKGEWVETEVPVDERGFLQKYWMYLLIPIIMSTVQNLKKS